MKHHIQSYVVILWNGGSTCFLGLPWVTWKKRQNVSCILSSSNLRVEDQITQNCLIFMVVSARFRILWNWTLPINSLLKKHAFVRWPVTYEFVRKCEKNLSAPTERRNLIRISQKTDLIPLKFWWNSFGSSNNPAKFLQIFLIPTRSIHPYPQ